MLRRFVMKWHVGSHYIHVHSKLVKKYWRIQARKPIVLFLMEYTLESHTAGSVYYMLFFWCTWIYDITREVTL